MRKLLIISAAAFVVFSCVKKPSTSPVPTLEFKDFYYMSHNGSDSGIIVLGYEDGDGDIFRDTEHTKPNLIITTFHKDSVSGLFIRDSVQPGGAGHPKIAISYATTVYQPGDGYKGKAVKGDIYVPYNEFRVSRAIKTLYHTAYIEDEAGHVSNVVFSPTVTLNF